MAIPRKMHWTPPPPSPLSNEHRQAPPPAAAPAPGPAGAAAPARQSFPVRKTPMQEKLVRRLQRRYARSAQAQAPAAPASAPASAGARAAVLGRLLHALLRNDDAATIAACRMATHTASGQPSFDASHIACLEGLSAWLGSANNTSRFKSVTALMYCDQTAETRAALQPFVTVHAQTQVPVQERIFGAIERLRAHMGDAVPGAPDRAAALRRLELAFFERDPAVALNVYKALAPHDTRPAHDIDRDLKDLRKLTRRLGGGSDDGASIRSLNAIVDSTDNAAIRRAIRPLASGNSPLEMSTRIVEDSVTTLRELARDALRMNAAASSARPRGTKRHASGEAGESSASATRRRVAQPAPEQAPPGRAASSNAVNEDTDAADAAGGTGHGPAG